MVIVVVRVSTEKATTVRQGDQVAGTFAICIMLVQDCVLGQDYSYVL